MATAVLPAGLGRLLNDIRPVGICSLRDGPFLFPFVEMGQGAWYHGGNLEEKERCSMKKRSWVALLQVDREEGERSVLGLLLFRYPRHGEG